MKTYIPHQDRNKLLYNGKTLYELSTLDDQPQYSYRDFLRRSATIDVIRFNQRKMPDSFFEVEHSTDIQNSLLKFSDLIDLHVRMIIVADAGREMEFKHKMSYHAFDELRSRKLVSFLNYDNLIKQYEMESEKQSFDVIL